MKISVFLVSLPLMLGGLTATADEQANQQVRGEASAAENVWLEEYRDTADQLIEASLSAENKGVMWDRLGRFTDYFPHRLSGSRMLEDAIDWSVEGLKADGFHNVRKQAVMVPHWVRNDESATMFTPGYDREMKILGLGGTVPTADGGVRAEVLVVGSREELRQRADEAEGRIVVWNVPFTTYGETVQYRVSGAVDAAKAGAVASLIRSVTPYSMQTPHTGGTRYDDEVTKIPFAAITIEDAELMQRFQDRGETVEVQLELNAEWKPDALSYNVIAEIPGAEKPEEVVVMGCHIDSWDVGNGVMDCGSGVIATWEAARMMLKLDLQPRRTIRLVFWTNEENGMRGSHAYRDKIMNNGGFENHQIAFEIDGGVFEPFGFAFEGSDEAFDLLQPILELTSPVGVTEFRAGRANGTADIRALREEGMPIMGIDVDRERYFWYHHADADTMDKQDPDHIARVIAATAVTMYVIADMNARLPW